ncbi:hypothetical protein PR048_015850 [Dryococelus australis]|uniref:Uncharacterized protein n=1 Tax=Dryococelus australis TaxID=614101 RepID=A0ABQ9HI29_9NEOP|nr:hypothetical protein PR048_015850 [Dryococelus australis]
MENERKKNGEEREREGGGGLCLLSLQPWVTLPHDNLTRVMRTYIAEDVCPLAATGGSVRLHVAGAWWLRRWPELHWLNAAFLPPRGGLVLVNLKTRIIAAMTLSDARWLDARLPSAARIVAGDSSEACHLSGKLRSLRDVSSTMKNMMQETSVTSEEDLYGSLHSAAEILAQNQSPLVVSIDLSTSTMPCSGWCYRVVRLLAFHPGEPDSTPGFWHVRIVWDDATDWRFFSGNSSFPRPYIFRATPYLSRFNFISSQDLDVKKRPHLSPTLYPLK